METLMISGLPQTVAETGRFLKDAGEAGITDDERTAIVQAVATDPTGGEEVQGSGGVRKVRVAGRGRGKSGGYRIMVAYVGEEAPVYILALFSKGDRANFSRQEIDGMRSLTKAIRHHWRERRRG